MRIEFLVKKGKIIAKLNLNQSNLFCHIELGSLKYFRRTSENSVNVGIKFITNFDFSVLLIVIQNLVSNVR